MLRTLIRRKLGQPFGVQWSRRLGHMLLWPTWAVFNVADKFSLGMMQHLMQVMRWHHQLGVGNFIICGSELFASTHVVRLVRYGWYEGYKLWLTTRTIPSSTTVICEVLRNGVSGVALLLDTSSTACREIERLAEIQKAVRHANLKVLVSLDPAAPDHSLATIEAGLAHDLTVEVDIIDGTSTHIESILEAFGLNRLKILANAIDDQWAVVAARGCSCHDPMSGWFIDHQYQTQICLSRDALGFLDRKRVRQLWLSPNAILQHQVGCPRSKMYSSDIWRSPTSQRRCGVSLGPPAQKVSVVVPSYGRSPKLIARTLNALLHQDYPKDFYDITLVDDGNPDDSVRAAVSICEEPSRIRYIRAIHGGAASARNHGIRASHGDIVVFTDDDCEPTSNWITDLVTGFFDDGIGGVGGRTVPRLQGNIIVRFLDQRRALRRFMVDKDSEKPDILPTANAAYRRTVLVEIGGFSEQFARMGLSYGGEDRDLTWRVIKAGHRISINLNAWVYHEHRSTLWQLIEQGYQYGRGCYVHCRIAGLPYDYEPRLLTLFRVFQEYLLPYVSWVRRYYREGASLGDSLVFPMLDFLRRFASAYGAYVTHKRWGYYHPNSAQIN